VAFGTDMEIPAGRQARVRPNGSVVSAVSPEEAQRRLAWRDGLIWLDGDPLSYAVAEMNRYNSTVLVIDDPAIADMRLGGAFKATNVDHFVSSLHRVLGIHSSRVERSGWTEIHLRS